MGFQREMGLRLRFQERRLLDVLALAVEPVELRRDAARILRVLGQQEACAEARIADAAARVDPRSHEIAQMPPLRGLAQSRDVEERGKSRAPAPAHHGEALAHEGAVEAVERHHVGHGGEGHEIEGFEEIGLGAPGEEPALAKRPVEGDEGEEHDARGAQVP
jgi:hypothetical protein